MSKRLNNEVLLGGFIVVAGGLLAYMSLAVGGLNMTPGVHVTARFGNAAGLVKDAVVSVAGVQVGHIERLEVDHDQAVVHLFLRRDANIRSDVHATIRAKSLLGEKYLELEPQSRDAALMPDGGQVAVTIPSVEVDEVLAALGPLIKKVNPEDIATIVHLAARTLNDNGGDIDALVKHANSIATQVDQIVKKNHANIDQAVANVASLSKEGNSLLQHNRPQLERTLANVDHLSGEWNRQSPSLLAKGQRIATNADHLVAHLNHEAPNMTRDAKQALAKLPGALDDLHGMGHDVNNTLRKVDPLLDKANSITPGKLQDFAHEALVRTGIKVYIGPFGPSEDDYRKRQQEQVEPVPAPSPAKK